MRPRQQQSARNGVADNSHVAEQPVAPQQERPPTQAELDHAIARKQTIRLREVLVEVQALYEQLDLQRAAFQAEVENHRKQLVGLLREVDRLKRLVPEESATPAEEQPAEQ